jgi:hypothetical protein
VSGWTIFWVLVALPWLAALLAYLRLTPRLRRLRLRIHELDAVLVTEGLPVVVELERMYALSEERQRLLEPYRRLLRRLQHPLIRALLASYRRGSR